MSVTALKIRVFGDSVLRQKAKLVSKVTDEHRGLLHEMAALMYESAGIGLAAPQVGSGDALIVVDIGSGLYKLINPAVIKKEGSQAIEEGCLSVPGVCIKVKRAQKVLVKALDEQGKPVEIIAEDLFACVLQHEIDHLKGKLIVDYASLLDRIKIKTKLEALRRKAENEKLSQSNTKSCKLQL